IYPRGVVRGCCGGQPAPCIAVRRNRVVAHESRVVGKDTEFTIRRNLPVQVCDHERGALINGEQRCADANLRSHTATLPDGPAKGTASSRGAAAFCPCLPAFHLVFLLS